MASTTATSPNLTYQHQNFQALIKRLVSKSFPRISSKKNNDGEENRGSDGIKFEVLSTQEMGFSGATVATVRVHIDNYATKSAKISASGSSTVDKPIAHYLFIKHVVLTAPATMDASAGSTSREAMLKHARNIKSYEVESACIDHLFPLMDSADPPLGHPMVYFKETSSSSSSELSGSAPASPTGTTTHEIIGTNFSFVSQSLVADGMAQTPYVSSESGTLEASILWLARFHALTFGKLKYKNYHKHSTGTGTATTATATSAIGASKFALLEEEGLLWEEGMHLSLNKRPEGEIHKLPAIWEGICNTFGDDPAAVAAGLVSPEVAAVFQDSSVRQAGRRLAAAAEEISRRLTPTSSATRAARTAIVHGDFKTANIFFQASSSGSTSSSSSGAASSSSSSGAGGGGDGSTDGTRTAISGPPFINQQQQVAMSMSSLPVPVPAPAVKVIDYQWTGPGVAVTDLLYLVAMGWSTPPGNVRTEVLHLYYQYFSAAMSSSSSSSSSSNSKINGKDKDMDKDRDYNYDNEDDREVQGDPIYEYYSMEELELDWKLALLDFTRWAFCARLEGDSPAKYHARKCKMDVNLGAWRRDPEMLAWLAKNTAQYLDDLGL